MVNFTGINRRAMLVGLHISTWSARKFDRKVSDKVTSESRADKDAGRFNKHLLAGSEAHKRVMDAAQRARELHYRETLPWADEGQRLLPTANYFPYMEKMRKAQATFDAAVADFVAEYPAIKAQAPVKLGALYNEHEFPTFKDLPSKFSWDIAVMPVPGGNDVRLDLPADQIEAIEASVNARVEQAAKDAMADAWKRLQDAVERIRKASGENGVVRSTLIENAEMVCDTLQRLNLAQDAHLEEMRQRVRRELTSIAVEDLRGDERLRADTERRANDILDAMKGMYAASAAA